MTQNKVSEELIDSIIDNAEVRITTCYRKCTVVSMQLENGFVIVESSACVDPNNYDGEIGRQQCMKRIRERLYELESYLLQSKLYNLKQI